MYVCRYPLIFQIRTKNKDGQSNKAITRTPGQIYAPYSYPYLCRYPLIFLISADTCGYYKKKNLIFNNIF